MSKQSVESLVAEYRAAWNNHDPEAIVGLFAEDGSYTDPTIDGELTGDPIGEHAARLFEAFPNLMFETVQLTTIGDGAVLFEWVMRGTNDGPFHDLPPTGETVDLPGADIIEGDSGALRSVRGYFDSGLMLNQLGHRVDVQPEELGAIKFGISYRLDLAKKIEPGAFSLTYIKFRDEDDREAVGERVQQILGEMEQMDGVISVLIARNGGHGYTITAWEDLDGPKQLMRGGVHQLAAKELFETDGLGVAAMTSVWTPERINGRLIRCPQCDEVTYNVEAESCPQCVAPLPEEPPYW